MHNLLISLKSLLLIFIVWFTDKIVLQITLFTFVNPLIKEFFVETKEIIAWVTSFLILILTIYKIRNEKTTSRRGNKDQQDVNEK